MRHKCSSALVLLVLVCFLFPIGAVASESKTCIDLKQKATSRYGLCSARANLRRGSREKISARCIGRIQADFDRADQVPGCAASGGAANVVSVLDAVQLALTDSVSSGTPIVVMTEPVCDPSTAQLVDHEAWRREAGFWVGEYTFLGADGNPNQSDRWPYRYDHYMGFIHIEIDGPSLVQRNVFLYPPQHQESCTGEVDEEGNPLDVKGGGTCGINGNEKIFSADQSASDCNGSLSGPFPFGDYVLDTQTRIIGDDSVLYQVRLYPGGPLSQNQLTTLPGNEQRVRTAQGFNPFTGTPSYASFYREIRVTPEEFFSLLEEARSEYNVLPADECAWAQSNEPSDVTCDEHLQSSCHSWSQDEITGLWSCND